MHHPGSPCAARAVFITLMLLLAILPASLPLGGKRVQRALVVSGDYSLDVRIAAAWQERAVGGQPDVPSLLPQVTIQMQRRPPDTPAVCMTPAKPTFHFTGVDRFDFDYRCPLHHGLPAASTRVSVLLHNRGRITGTWDAGTWPVLSQWHFLANASHPRRTLKLVTRSTDPFAALPPGIVRAGVELSYTLHRTGCRDSSAEGVCIDSRRELCRGTEQNVNGADLFGPIGVSVCKGATEGTPATAASPMAQDGRHWLSGKFANHTPFRSTTSTPSTLGAQTFGECCTTGNTAPRAALSTRAFDLEQAVNYTSATAHLFCPLRYGPTGFEYDSTAEAATVMPHSGAVRRHSVWASCTLAAADGANHTFSLDGLHQLQHMQGAGNRNVTMVPVGTVCHAVCLYPRYVYTEGGGFTGRKDTAMFTCTQGIGVGSKDQHTTKLVVHPGTKGPGMQSFLTLERHKLGLCEGDCDRDGHCHPGLLCRQWPTGNDPHWIPGCGDAIKDTHDYCFDPSAMPAHQCFFGKGEVNRSYKLLHNVTLSDCHWGCAFDKDCEGVDFIPKKRAEKAPKLEWMRNWNSLYQTITNNNLYMQGQCRFYEKNTPRLSRQWDGAQYCNAIRSGVWGGELSCPAAIASVKPSNDPGHNHGNGATWDDPGDTQDPHDTRWHSVVEEEATSMAPFDRLLGTGTGVTNAPVMELVVKDSGECHWGWSSTNKCVSEHYSGAALVAGLVGTGSRNFTTCTKKIHQRNRYNLPWCYNQAWVRNEHMYRVLPAAYPQSGSLQRASETRFHGLDGYMAMPDDATEQHFLRRVAKMSGSPLRLLDDARVHRLPKGTHMYLRTDNQSTRKIADDADFVHLPLTVTGKLAVDYSVRQVDDAWLTWHWADGPNASRAVWTGANYQCKDICANTTNNSLLTVSFNDDCKGCSTACGNLSYDGRWNCYNCALSTERKSAEMYTCYDSQCSRECGFMRGGHTVAGAVSPSPIPFKNGVRIMREKDHWNLYSQTLSKGGATFNIHDDEYVWQNQEQHYHRAVLINDEILVRRLYTTIVEYSVGHSPKTTWPACGPGGLCTCSSKMLDILILKCNHRMMVMTPWFPNTVRDVAYDRLFIQLQHNHLVEMPLKAFEHIDRQLLKIDLSYNRINAFNGKLYQLTLEELNLSFNKLTTIAEGALQYMPSLTRLQIQGNAATLCFAVPYDRVLRIDRDPIRNAIVSTSPCNKNITNDTGASEDPARVVSVPTTTTTTTATPATSRPTGTQDADDPLEAYLWVIIPLAVVLAPLCVLGLKFVDRHRKASSARARERGLRQRLQQATRERAATLFAAKYAHLTSCGSLAELIADLKTYEVPRCRVRQTHEIGRGVSGCVRVGTIHGAPSVLHRHGSATTAETVRSNESGRTQQPQVRATVAVKQRLPAENFGSVDEALLVEAMALRWLGNHECIVSLAAVVTEFPGPFLLCAEHMPKGDLVSYLRSCRPSQMKPRATITLLDVVTTATRVASAMRFLELNKVVHRDLAARNVLVGTSLNDVKVADLGALRSLHRADEYVAKKDHFPFRWMAPEALRLAAFSHKSDVWAFGVLLWEVTAYAKTPFGVLSMKEVAEGVMDGLRLEKNPFTPEGMYDIMLRCWDTEPARRPCFEEMHEQFAVQQKVMAVTGVCIHCVQH